MVVQKRFLQGDRQGQADNFLPISVPAQGRAATSPPRALHRRMTRALDDNLMERTRRMQQRKLATTATTASTTAAMKPLRSRTLTSLVCCRLSSTVTSYRTLR